MVAPEPDMPVPEPSVVQQLMGIAYEMARNHAISFVLKGGLSSSWQKIIISLVPGAYRRAISNAGGSLCRMS